MEALYIAIISAIPPTIAALAALVVGIINIVKSDKIHVLVNSQMSKVQADLAMATTRINELQEYINKNKQ